MASRDRRPKPSPQGPKLPKITDPEPDIADLGDEPSWQQTADAERQTANAEPEPDFANLADEKAKFTRTVRMLDSGYEEELFRVS